jgi:hypothetical protein
MIAPVRPFRSRTSSRDWQAGFLALLPKIIRRALVILPRLDPEARADALQEVVANAAVAYARLVELHKEELAYATPLATFAVRQYRAGRRIGSRLNVREVMSPYAQQRKRFTVESLDRFDDDENQWREAVVEDTRIAPVPDVVAFRCDFSDWLGCLSERDRRIAEFLALGNRTHETSRTFGVSAGRVSQLRKELAVSWREFRGEDAVVDAAARSQ